MTLLRLNSVSRRFGGVVAVDSVGFSIESGEIVGLMGANGAGKTTLFSLIAGNLRPTAGEILLDDRRIDRLRPDQISGLGVARTFQIVRPFAGLTVLENVAIGALFGSSREKSVTRANADARAVLEEVGLADRAEDYANALNLSGRKRLEIARALATKPEFVVLDEPTSMLDPSARAEILELLQDIQKELGTAFIFISHDLTSVAKISHRIAIMYLGHIVEHAPTDIIMHSQRHPYSRALLSAVLFPDPARPPDPYVIEGEIPTAINPKPECPLYGRCPIREDACRSAVPPMVEVEPDHFSACRRWRDVAASTQA